MPQSAPTGGVGISYEKNSELSFFCRFETIDSIVALDSF